MNYVLLIFDGSTTIFLARKSKLVSVKFPLYWSELYDISSFLLVLSSCQSRWRTHFYPISIAEIRQFGDWPQPVIPIQIPIEMGLQLWWLKPSYSCSGCRQFDLLLVFFMCFFPGGCINMISCQLPSPPRIDFLEELLLQNPPFWDFPSLPAGKTSRFPWRCPHQGWKLATDAHPRASLHLSRRWDVVEVVGSNGENPKVQEIPKHSYKVGPPSDVCWFINPMNTIVICVP